MFEDAIMISSMLLEKGVDITETVRVTGHIDEVFQAGLSCHTTHPLYYTQLPYTAVNSDVIAPTAS